MFAYLHTNPQRDIWIRHADACLAKAMEGSNSIFFLCWTTHTQKWLANFQIYGSSKWSYFKGFFPGPKGSASLGSASPTNVAIFHKEVCAGMSSLYSRQKASVFFLSIDLKHNPNLDTCTSLKKKILLILVIMPKLISGDKIKEFCTGTTEYSD